jgi:hypothetical protein
MEHDQDHHTTNDLKEVDLIKDVNMPEIDLKKLEEEAEAEMEAEVENKTAELEEVSLVDFPDVQKVEVINQIEPEIKVDVKPPEVNVTVPEIKVPDIQVPEPKVSVTVEENVSQNAILGDIHDLLSQPKEKWDEDEFIEKLGEEFKDKLDFKKALKGFHSSGWLPVVQSLESGNAITGIKATDSPSIDAFGRWRVSNPETIFDSKQLHDNAPLIYDDQEVSGGSTTSSHSTATASTTIGVGATTAGKRVRQSFMRFNYQPGKSQLIFCTGVLDKSGGGTGITRGFGYYDDNNGLFLQDKEGVIQFVKRSSTSGSPVDTEVNQSSWNIDTMDGTGASGITLDFSKAQILVIDFEWLGVGRVRMGFVVDGIVYYCHQFNHANSVSTVYMSTPNLPVRYEIDNDGTGAASTL